MYVIEKNIQGASMYGSVYECELIPLTCIVNKAPLMPTTDQNRAFTLCILVRSSNIIIIMRIPIIIHTCVTGLISGLHMSIVYEC